MLKLIRNIFILSFISSTAFAFEPLVLAEASNVQAHAPIENTIINNEDSPVSIDAPVATPTPAPNATDSNLIEFNIIDNGTVSGAKQDTAMLHTFTDQENWEIFWKKHMAVVPAPAAPAVDFQDQQVFAIVDSDQPNSGYYIRLERIEKQNNELWVYATREQPGTGCMSLGMIAQPYVIVTIDKTDLPAKLLLSTHTYDC